MAPVGDDGRAHSADSIESRDWLHNPEAFSRAKRVSEAYKVSLGNAALSYHDRRDKARHLSDTVSGPGIGELTDIPSSDGSTTALDEDGLPFNLGTARHRTRSKRKAFGLA